MLNHNLEIEYYETGGGVVINDAGEVLLLERQVQRQEGLRHEIRLPKGHIDPGESAEEAALREVCEESGYCELQILASLAENITIYRHKKALVTRKEYYFLMRMTSPKNIGPQFTPNSEEALFHVLWATNLDEAERLLTYESEKLFARRASKAQIGK